MFLVLKMYSSGLPYKGNEYYVEFCWVISLLDYLNLMLYYIYIYILLDVLYTFSVVTFQVTHI